MNIIAKTIDHKSARYPTIGDYFYKGDKLYFTISKLGDKRFEFLVLIHEMIEQFLTEEAGIKEEDILKFDVAFENGELIEFEGCYEPGDHPHSPYKKQHRFAENIERLIAQELGIDFNEYTNFLYKFWEENTEIIDNKRKEINPEIGK